VTNCRIAKLLARSVQDFSTSDLKDKIIKLLIQTVNLLGLFPIMSAKGSSSVLL